MAAKSQNGWPVIRSQNSKMLHNWIVPAKNGAVELLLRRGPAGFVLAHTVLWFSEIIEQVEGLGDDFGWNPRRISGSDEWSNHASATAGDVNASKHPYGSRTFTTEQRYRIRKRMSNLDGVVRWGGDYNSTVDEMHFEIAANLERTTNLAKQMLDTPRGERILVFNPNQKRYII